MGLETVAYIGDLDRANPTPDDPISQGDDHIRNLKVALQDAFPNWVDPTTGYLNATADELDQAVTDATNALETFNFKPATTGKNYDPTVDGLNDYNIEQIQDVGFGGSSDVDPLERNFLSDADKAIIDDLPNTLNALLPPGYITGLLINHANDGTFTVGSGKAEMQDNSGSAEWPGGTTHDVDVNWTDGGIGANPGIVLANAFYRVFLIKATDGSSSIGIDFLDDATTLLTYANANSAKTWNAYRRIGWSEVINPVGPVTRQYQMKPNGRCTWDTAVTKFYDSKVDVNGSNTTTAELTLGPPNVLAHVATRVEADSFSDASRAWARIAVKETQWTDFRITSEARSQDAESDPGWNDYDNNAFDLTLSSAGKMTYQYFYSNDASSQTQVWVIMWGYTDNREQDNYL